ncbi:OmpA family protein [Pseudoflavitalea sp. G-6-1-2]|uniref:OmpA family protein n=1 Tax=Pseudoflavitalea sp. G-6-1-2 TaxID=2728841 RepID=UPI00146CFAAD|nr:OmpA family protein [Pseudoflavitalea sp. G-6-1-2]NML21497.1 OmpA family protein [Pseudoflavitalea sp. G-6-1-2]
MRQYILLVILLVTAATIHAQSPIPKRAEQRAKDKANSKVDESVDKGIDSAFSKTTRAIGNLFKKKDKTKKRTDEEARSDESVSTSDRRGNIGNAGAGSARKVNSAGDFEPGGTVLFEDHFSKDRTGDFPANWNTNGSGKIVTIDGVEGKWLDVVHNCIITPVLNKPLPENCTIEFDLFLRSEGERSTPFIQFGLTEVRDILREDLFYKDRFFVNLHRYTEEDGKTLEYGLKNDVIGNKSSFPLTAYVNKVLHVALAVNKSRVRLYLDDNKIIDLPQALTSNMRNNFFLNNNAVIPASETGMYVGNIRIASGETDARSLLIKQLMEEGKAVTNDILFDVNSDRIKKESFSIINQFGDALQKNPSLKIKITGHTDNDGNDADNLTLSQKRAAAVKMYITENYAVAGSRIQTDGKGESQPIATNSTTDGKARNRRVEFVKL